ncbi:MAG: hypothetical protein MUF54_19935, partial [Polyangiaceae bacterium]|nr:hypothetical protein [Polyangiaceae bacterium]
MATPLPREACSSAPVRAVAVAHEYANAVGTVELSCTAQGLQLQFVRISAFTDGYVPYPMTSSLRTTVPYQQVARVTIDGDGLVHLVLDPSSTPYSKLALAGLVRDRAFDHAASYRRRARIERHVTLAALTAWMPVALILRVVWPDWSAWFVFALSATISALLHVMRRDVAAKLVLFTRQTEQVRDELIAELRWRLPPGRVLHDAPSELPSPAAAPAELGDADPAEAGSLKGLFVTAGIVTAAAAIAILVGKNLPFSTPAAPEAQWGQDTDEAWAWLDDDARPASGPPLPDKSSTSPIGPDTTPPKPPPPPCACDRADSPLWADGIPRMSVLTRNRPGTTSPERPSVYPEIAVVNNSAEDLKDIVMVVDFILGPR